MVVNVLEFYAIDAIILARQNNARRGQIMPIYEYQCGSCHHRLEKLQKISDKALTICPECEEESLSKNISAPGFRLKGTGWYETDFKTNNKKNLVKEDKSN